MRILRNPEYRGVLVLILVILGIGLVMSIATGKFEQWTGISLFSGPKAFDKIVFVCDSSGSPEICLMDAIGSGRKQLTTGARVRSAPAISPRGAPIVYVGRFGNSDQVFSVGADGGDPERLTSATGPKKQPEFTPDGKRLSFISSGRVYVAETNGDSPDPILPTMYEVRAAMSDPLRRNEVPAYYAYAWGPALRQAQDGALRRAQDAALGHDHDAGIVGVTKDADGNGTVVYLADPEAQPKFPPLKDVINVLLKREGTFKRRIAPDDRITVTGVGWALQAPVFAVSVASRSDSFLVIFLAEKGEVRIAWFRSFAGHQIGGPAFAPDGLSLAVATHSADGKSVDGLLKLDLKSGRGQMIASGDYERPAFSPGSDRIMATRLDKRRGTRDIYVIDIRTGKLTQLTRDGRSHDAVWTPASNERHPR